MALVVNPGFGARCEEPRDHQITVPRTLIGRRQDRSDRDQHGTERRGDDAFRRIRFAVLGGHLRKHAGRQRLAYLEQIGEGRVGRFAEGDVAVIVRDRVAVNAERLEVFGLQVVCLVVFVQIRGETVSVVPLGPVASGGAQAVDFGLDEFIGAGAVLPRRPFIQPPEIRQKNRSDDDHVHDHRENDDGEESGAEFPLETHRGSYPAGTIPARIN